MKNKDEIIKELVAIDILFEVNGLYILTEKWKELLKNSSTVIETIPEAEKKLDRDVLLDSSTNGTDWSSELLDSKGRTRAGLLMDLCEIPVKAEKGYRLRGLDNESVNIIGNIIESDHIIPATFIASVKKYYETEEMPKSFKNFLTQGTVIEVYEEYISGGYNPNSIEGQKTW